MALASNVIEYAVWNEDEIVPEHDFSLTGKYTSTVTNILSKHCTEVKLSSEEMCQNLTTVSKKKLKEMISKQNNELFAFMSNPEKSHNIMSAAEEIFYKYERDAPTIKGNDRYAILKDLNLNASLDHVVAEFDENLKKLKGDGGLDDFMKQMKWLFQQYKTIGEEILRLETTLFQKIEVLDKLQKRISIITTLGTNDALPPLIDSFTNYVRTIYESSQFEENYKELVEGYKKWNICRQIISLSSMMQNSTGEPLCSICLTEPISNVIVPCGHTFCGSCSKKQNTTCYICRGQIRERVKLYIC